VYDKVKVGLARMEKIAKDRMTIITDLEDAVPGSFINSRPMIAVMREFFGTNQLSQFMDQSNPLSELAHKRRVTALGVGGLTRERASFEVRDVHPTQYGRICPIATPEGPNIGLVLHFASYAKVDKYGFITTPFRKIEHFVKNDEKSLLNRITLEDILDAKGKIIVPEKTLITQTIAKDIVKHVKEDTVKVRGFLTTDYQYFDAYEERSLVVAEANTPTDEYGNFLTTSISARKASEASVAHINDVTHIDISPKQVMSETTTLIPFLEHDDATRAEMGTNMMRQAVPLVHAEAPIVGTGMERIIGEGSGYVIKAPEAGEVIGVDAKHISVIYASGKKVTYSLMTFERSNHDMIVHQWARVSPGEKFESGKILADGQAIDNGELAVGRNLRVAYMPWEGYNYEDAIIISERLMQDDYYTSVHINEYVMDVRETKLGPESTTNDIPNVSTQKLKDLDVDGIVRIGAYVRASDILVGKVTPKGEVELSPEERLLRAIFGDKSKDVKDSSLILPSGSGGKVIGVHTLRREDGDNLPTGVFKQVKVYIAQTRKIEVGDKMAGRHGNKGIVSRIVPVEDMPFDEDGIPVDIILNPLGVISRMNIGQVLETHLGGAAGKLGIKVATPILQGLSTKEIGALMEKAGIPADGKVQLYNGKTGEPFKEKTMVGIKYMLKLHHLVEDKIHARSVGPYSMVTQQPLGGKAQNG
jgi:DNA-directed RNA polymerase subunit beta